MACNLNCLFCFSKSSISTLRHDSLNWQKVDIRRYYEFARERGAERLVITGGGEPKVATMSRFEIFGEDLTKAGQIFKPFTNFLIALGVSFGFRY